MTLHATVQNTALWEVGGVLMKDVKESHLNTVTLRFFPLFFRIPTFASFVPTSGFFLFLLSLELHNIKST